MAEGAVLTDIPPRTQALTLDTGNLSPERRLKPMEKMNLEAEVVRRVDDQNSWGVEAIDYPQDGSVYMAIFSGPDAEQRAREYAHFKFTKTKSLAA